MKGEGECEDEMMKCKQEDEFMGLGRWGCGSDKDGGFRRAILGGDVGEIDEV